MDRIRVVVAKPLEQKYADRIAASDDRLEVINRLELTKPMRWPSDHEGDPSFVRTPEQQAEFDAMVDSADVLYGIPDTSPAALARTIRANPKLKWVQTMAAGGGSQVKAAQLTADELERVTFTTSAGVHAQCLAEFAIFGLMAGAKGLPTLLDHKARHFWSPSRWVMRQVGDMRILVVGLGNIGAACAQRAHDFGATVVAVNRRVRENDAVEHVYQTDEIVQAAQGCDAIINALPGAVGTEKLISRAVLEALNPGAIVVSVGRGTCIDEQAMIDLLASGHLGFACLDVTAVEPLPEDSPLWDMDNVIIAPHTAANSDLEDSRIADQFIGQMQVFLQGGRLRNVVDTTLFY